MTDLEPRQTHGYRTKHFLETLFDPISLPSVASALTDCQKAQRKL